MERATYRGPYKSKDFKRCSPGSLIEKELHLSQKFERNAYILGFLYQFTDIKC